jgi:hypothetical protein
MEHSHSWEPNSSSASPDISRIMKPQSSLPCSQQQAACPCRIPDPSVYEVPACLLYDPF